MAVERWEEYLNMVKEDLDMDEALTMLSLSGTG